MYNPYSNLRQKISKIGGQPKLLYDGIISMIHAITTFTMTYLYMAQDSDSKKVLNYIIFTINSLSYFYHDIGNHGVNIIYAHHIISSLLFLFGFYKNECQPLIMYGMYTAELSNFAILTPTILFKSSFKPFFIKHKVFILIPEISVYGYYRIYKGYFIINAALNIIHNKIVQIFAVLIYFGGIVWTILLLKQLCYILYHFRSADKKTNKYD